jgi:hypothetical protein
MNKNENVKGEKIYSLGKEFFIIKKTYYSFKVEKIKIIAIKNYIDGRVKYYYSDDEYFTDNDVQYRIIFIKEEEANKILLNFLKELLEYKNIEIEQIKLKIKETKDKLKGFIKDL